VIVVKPAYHQTRVGFAKTMGAKITSGGMGKKKTLQNSMHPDNAARADVATPSAFAFNQRNKIDPLVLGFDVSIIGTLDYQKFLLISSTHGDNHLSTNVELL